MLHQERPSKLSDSVLLKLSRIRLNCILDDPKRLSSTAISIPIIKAGQMPVKVKGSRDKVKGERFKVQGKESFFEEAEF